MVKRNDWMPRTFGGLDAMFENVKTKIGDYATPLGLSPADVTEIETLCAEFNSVYDFYTENHAAALALTEWRDGALRGTPAGENLKDPPTFSTFTNDPDFKIGILDLFREYRDRIVAASGYTQSIGEDLMIATPQGAPADPSAVKPELRVFAAAAGGSLFSAVVSDRAGADQWVLSAAPVGTSDWQQLGTFTGKSADVTWPGAGTQPVQLQVRVQLRKTNANYGQPSDITTVTIVP